MSSADATRASYRQADTAYWQDFYARRPVTGYRIGADQFSPRALLFAIPMASALWLAAAILGYAWL